MGEAIEPQGLKKAELNPYTPPGCAKVAVCHSGGDEALYGSLTLVRPCTSLVATSRYSHASSGSAPPEVDDEVAEGDVSAGGSSLEAMACGGGMADMQAIK